MIGDELGRVEKNVLVVHAELFDVDVQEKLEVGHLDAFAAQVEAVDGDNGDGEERIDERDTRRDDAEHDHFVVARRVRQHHVDGDAEASYGSHQNNAEQTKREDRECQSATFFSLYAIFLLKRFFFVCLFVFSFYFYNNN